MDRVCVVFPERNIRALDDVSITIGSGERVALLGPSGSGKSTLLRALLGAVPYTGRISVGGRDPSDAAEVRALRRQCGVIRQGADLVPGLSGQLNAVMGSCGHWGVRDWVAVATGRVPRQFAHRLAALADVNGVRTCLSARCSELSGGQRQRIALVRALLSEPALVLGDEPTTGLDPLAADRTARALVGVDAKTVVVATHDLAVASRFDRVIALRSGQVVFDGPSLDESARAAVYGGSA